MSDTNNLNPVPDPVAPTQLAEDLRRLHHPEVPIQIPAEVHERVEQMARWRLSHAAQQNADLHSQRSGPIHIGTARNTPARFRRLAGMRWIAFSSSAAAVVVIAALLWPIVRGSPRTPSRSASSQTPAPSVPGTIQGESILMRASLEDINNDGVVDILDSQRLSFLLVNQPASVKPEWDVSADGHVNEDDAKAIARHVVARKEGGA